jgi:class 3 adenylate cyclase
MNSSKKILYKLIKSQTFQIITLVAIFLEFILLIIQLFIPPHDIIQLVSSLLLQSILILLIFENLVGLYLYSPRFWRYFYDPWNTLTFLVSLVLILFPSQKYATLLRVPKAFRILITPVRLTTIKGLSIIKIIRIIEGVAFNKAFNLLSQQLQISFKALSQSESRNRALLLAIPDLIFEINYHGILLDFSEAEGIFPVQVLNVKEYIGKTIYTIFPETLSLQYLNAIHTVLATQNSYTFEHDHWIQQKNYIYESQIMPYNHNSVLCMMRNITQRKQAEVELRRSEKTNQALILAIPDLLIRMTRDGTYLGVVQGNDTQQFNAAKESEKNANIREILPPDLANQRIQQIQHALDTKLAQTYEQTITIQNRKYYEEVRIVPMEQDEVLVIIRDITVRKQAEEALRQSHEYLEKRVAQRTAELQLEKDRSEQLLLNILPASIAKQLQMSGESPTQYFEAATILFADIVGFTGLAARMEPLALVGTLNRIFSAFDEMIDQYQLEKIKTIGDAYMVVGGLPLPHQNHAGAIADMALAMRHHMQHQYDDFGHPLQIRIGINTGPVIGGVIGLKRFIYDLWGDAVNVASRMESQSEPGQIQVTESTYQRLKQDYVLEERGMQTIKGRGEMMTYWLHGKKS